MGPWLVRERLRYDWSQPGSLRATVIDSNLFKPGSTWELHVTPAENGSKVEIVAVRHLKQLGWLIWPFFPTGLGRRDVYGCSPSCLMISLVASVLLTVFLNVLIRVF